MSEGAREARGVGAYIIVDPDRREGDRHGSASGACHVPLAEDVIVQSNI